MQLFLNGRRLKRSEGESWMTSHFVEELIHRFEVEQQKNDRGGIYALTQRMMAYNSIRSREAR